uniref:Uncharacterized protein n=1 Tax=Babesia bovis TaxID=5865 RepID=S6C923_BABBO|nr:hypothetical protein [Babesia bovis]
MWRPPTGFQVFQSSGALRIVPSQLQGTSANTRPKRSCSPFELYKLGNLEAEHRCWHSDASLPSKLVTAADGQFIPLTLWTRVDKRCWQTSLPMMTPRLEHGDCLQS